MAEAMRRGLALLTFLEKVSSPPSIDALVSVGVGPGALTLLRGGSRFRTLGWSHSGINCCRADRRLNADLNETRGQGHPSPSRVRYPRTTEHVAVS